MGDEKDNLENLDLGGGANPDNKPVTPEPNPEIQRRDAQINHWRSKAEAAEAKLAEAKPQPAPEKVEEWVAPKDPLEIVKLGKVLQGYDEVETEFIIKNAQTKDIDGITKAEKDELVQMAIKSRRDKVAKENKIPSPSAPGSGFQRKSPQEIAKMSREEHMAYEQQVQSAERVQGV